MIPIVKKLFPRPSEGSLSAKNLEVGDYVTDKKHSDYSLAFRDYGVVVSPQEWAERSATAPMNREIKRGLKKGYYFLLKRYFGKYEVGISANYEKITPREELASFDTSVNEEIEGSQFKNEDDTRIYIEQLRDKLKKVTAFLGDGLA